MEGMITASDLANSVLILTLVLFTAFAVFGLCVTFCCYVMLRTSNDVISDVEASQEIQYNGLKRLNYKRKWTRKATLKSDTCAICLEDFHAKDEMSLCKCGHAYHHKCIMKWMEIKDTCPICQRHCRQPRNEPGREERTPLLLNSWDM